MRATIGVLSLVLASSALAETTFTGDRENGAALFRVQCGACHGVDGFGAGPLAAALPTQVGNLRDPAFLATRSDDDLRAAMLKGIQRDGKRTAMPAAPWLSSLEMLDLITFLREGELKVSDFYPTAKYFFAKTYPLNADAQGRLQKLFGRPLSVGDKSVTVVTVYGDGTEGGPTVIPDDPVQLDKLNPRDAQGYVVFADLPHGKGHGMTGIALSRAGQIKQIKSVGGLKAADDKEYQAFVGLGSKTENAALKPKGKTSPASLKAFNEAYVRGREGVWVADREEKDRHWADTK